MAKALNLAGRKYGRLTVIERVESQKRSKWLCKCECGESFEVIGSYLINGDTKSCGCLKIEQNKHNLRSEYNNKRVDGVMMPLFKGKEPLKDNSTTGYRGVHKYYTRKSKQLRYKAYITVKGKRYYKGGFMTAEEAYYNGRVFLENKYLPKLEEDENDKRRN